MRRSRCAASVACIPAASHVASSGLFLAFNLVSTGLRPWRQRDVPLGLSWIVAMELVGDDRMRMPGWCLRMSAVLSIGIDAAFWGF